MGIRESILRNAAAALCLAAGCQSAFQRDAAYGKSEEKGSRTAARAATVHATAFEDVLHLAPTNASADVEAKFSCDVQRPDDAALARFADATLTLAYCHARGEDRKDVASAGVRSVRDAFFDDYREWFAETWADVEKGDMAAHIGCWSCHVEGRVELCDKNYFSYRVTIDTYCGGAHPNRWIQNATYSRSSGRRLKAADVIRRESRTAVVNLIRQAVRKETHDDEMLNEMLAEEISQPYDDYVREIRDHKREEWGNPLVTDNFMLTKDGIVWTYNQYEIACYASGFFDALVTWRELTPHVNGDMAQMCRGVSMPSR